MIENDKKNGFARLSRANPFFLLMNVMAILWLAACQPAPAMQPEGQAPGLTALPAASTTPLSGQAAQPSPMAASPTPEQAFSANTPETANQTPSATPAATGKSTHYLLNARYNHASHSLEVEQHMVYTNQTTDNLANLILMVEPNRYPGVFQLTRLTWENGDNVEGFFLENNRLTIPLPQLLPPGGQVGLELSFNLALPPIPEDSEEYKPVPFGYTARQANLVDWFPFLPPYREGEGWLAHNAWFFGEHQVYDVADYDVEFEASGSSEPLVLAASAQPESQDGNLTRYHLEQARTFVISISPYYQTYTQQVGDTTVTSYGLPYFEAGAQAALQYTADALALYNTLYGPYPRRSLSVVVADFLDGMEYDGLYFLSRGFYNTYDGTPANYLAIIAVHETAHQWWYAQVGNDQALEPWLDEALCTYSERLFYEHQYPDLVSWWWAFRVNFYQPSGLVGGAVYDYAGFRPYRDAVYLRGAQFLEALRQRVGDEVFLQFLRDYAGRMAGKQARAADFFSILAEHSSTDITDLRQEYFGP